MQRNGFWRERLTSPVINGRWVRMGIVAAALLLMALYTLTDANHLAHDPALTGGDWLGAAICHRITERSFTINGRQFPLCARCTGMYLGVAIAFGVLLLAGRARWAAFPRLPVLLTLIGFIGLMGVDGINSYTHFFPNFPHVYEPRNWLRLVTGMGAGLAMGVIMFTALAQTLWRNTTNQAAVANLRELGGIVVVAGTAVLLLLSNQPAIMYVMAIASVAGILLIIMAINAVLLLILFRRDAQADHWRQTAVPLTICLLIGIAQLSLLTYLRVTFLGTLTGFPGL